MLMACSDRTSVPPTYAPTAMPTRTAVPTPTVTPTVTPTPGPTQTSAPTAMPTSADTLAGTEMPAGTTTLAPTAIPTPTVTPTVTHTPGPIQTSGPTETPTRTAIPTPTAVTASSFGGQIGAIAKIDLELAKQVGSYGWVADGVTGDEWIPLAIIRELAEVDVEVARLISGRQWLADGVTKHEQNGINYLIRISEHDPQFAMLVLRQPFMEPPFRHRDALALSGLHWLVNFSSDTQVDFIAMVAGQPWFLDGVDDAEAALLKVFETCTNEFIQVLIESNYVESVRVQLPLAGDVDLVAIRHTPFPPEDNTLVAMEEGIRAIEGFMGTPFPINDVIVLVVDPDVWQRGASGSVVGGWEPGFDSRHILVNRRDIFDVEGLNYKSVIYHELGHFYTPFAPRWLSEGGAEFLTAYTRDKVGTESIEDRLAYLQSSEAQAQCGKQNLRQHMDDYRPNQCDYYLGELFLLAMYTILGEEGVSAAMKDLHSHVVANLSSPHIDLIYLEFAKYAPPEKLEDFQAAYFRYYGGPIIALGPPSPDRRTALTALYNATHGPTWVNRDNWLSDMPLTSWYGVTAGEADQVAGLVLGYNELSGEIPPELGRLTNLVELDLSSNKLTGPIPPELGSLTKLRVLGLGGNQLTGAIPAELGNLIELEDLFIGDSQFTGGIPPELGGLTKLGRLYIVAAHLSGEIPPELGQLTNLRGLRLEANQLTGEIPPELGRLTQLWRLELHDNQLSGEIPPELAGLTRLGLLDLSANHLVGEIPPELGSFPNLTRALDLSMNRLVGEIPSELGSLTEVGRLDLSGNQLTGTIPRELGGLAELSNLNLSENQLSGEIPPELGHLSQLWRLRLSGNNLVGEIPAELARLTLLKTLDLSQNQLTGEITLDLGSLPYLQELYLSGNQFTGCIPQELRNVPINDFQELGITFCGADP